MKAQFKNKVFTLQLERIRALSTSVSRVETKNAVDQTDRVSSDSGDSEQVRQLEVLIENQIQKETSQNMLRSATRWHEQGERNNKYFYRVIKERQSQQTIQSLKCSTTGDILVDAAAINREAQGFYQRLYTPDAVDADAIDTLLENVPPDVCLSSLDADMLMEMPSCDVVFDLLTHAPKSKSPGLDGLPFELYQYLAGVSSDFLSLLVDVLSGAFNGVLPPSWQQTRMVLLFKKGDPQLLVNWRPLYHTESQLQDYLDGVLVKVQRHSNLLKQRNFSIRGAGLVANSLLLSKVYHLLRVVPGGATTESWVKALKKVVREYLVSFRIGVVWSTLCLPRKFGGVGLVDIVDQSLALHLVYLQRLLRPLSSSDFVSSWLVYALQVYTGHKSVLPWFSFPEKFKSRVSSVPVLRHLSKLLLKLPKLVPSSGWSARWFLDLPLCSVLSTVASVRPPCDPSSLDPRFLVSDISFWQPDLGIVDGVTSHLAWSSRLLRPIYLAVNRDRGPVSPVFPPVMDSKIVLSQADYFTMPSSDGATTWMPDCSHWTISNSSRSSVAVARLSLGALRRYWHPSRGAITTRMGPPLRLPDNLLLSSALWRLLHNRVGHRSWCHRIVPDKVVSPVCALCGLFEEDLYHFVVGCHVKSFFWQDAVSLLSLQELFPSDSSIWVALTSLGDSDSVVIDEDVLVALGAAYSTLWKYHWRCVIDEEPWIASAVLNMVRQDHGSLFSSLSLASVQTGTLTLPLINT